MGITDKKEDEHPAYGTIGFYRTSGDPGKMFGSAIPQHGHFIAMSIKRAVRHHDLNHDWIRGTGEELINIWLSAAQFAELLTTMNVGSGVPCTIKRFNGEKYDMPQDEKTEADRVHTNFEEKLKVFGQSLKEKTNSARDMLRAKGAINKGAREQIAKTLEWVHREIESNMPFALRSFQEAVEKTSTHAKAELDAMVSHVITTKGLKAIDEDNELFKKLSE